LKSGAAAKKTYRGSQKKGGTPFLLEGTLTSSQIVTGNHESEAKKDETAEGGVDSTIRRKTVSLGGNTCREMRSLTKRRESLIVERAPEPHGKKYTVSDKKLIKWKIREKDRRKATQEKED